jgi:hypothetical protein
MAGMILAGFDDVVLNQWVSCPSVQREICPPINLKSASVVE